MAAPKNVLDEKHWERTRLLFGPTAMNSEVDPSTVRILDTVIGIFIGFRVDLFWKAGFLQSPLDVFQIVDLETVVVDPFLLIVTLNFNESDVDVTVRHIDGASKSPFRLQAENFRSEERRVGK